MEPKLAIVGVFYDGYYDIWEDFLELVTKNWPDCPYPIYIVNGEKELEFQKTYNVKVLHAGRDAEYSLRVQTALNEIDADYFLLLLEDFFFAKKIEKDPLESIVETIARNDIHYLRMNMPEFLVGVNKGRFKKDEDSGFLFIPSSDEYTITCQPSIWEKQFLIDCIGKGNYNAWVFEGMYSYSRTAHEEVFLKKCRMLLSNPLGLRHGAVQGKMLPNVYDDIKKSGYEFKNKREVLDEKQYNKHLTKQKLKGMIPLKIQKLIKKIVKRDSVLGKYKEQIILQMQAMHLE